MTECLSEQRESSCIEDTEELEEGAFPDYERVSAPVAVSGKYQCRYCGLLFDTLEEYQEHYREVHAHAQIYLNTANQS